MPGGPSTPTSSLVQSSVFGQGLGLVSAVPKEQPNFNPILAQQAGSAQSVQPSQPVVASSLRPQVAKPKPNATSQATSKI
jgi:hypothetical protein